MSTRFAKLVAFAANCDGAQTASHAMVESQALSLVSTWVNFWRIQVAESEYNKIYPSTLVLVEAPTGSGKNAAYRFMHRHIFGFPFRYMENLLFERETALRELYVNCTNVKYPVGDEGTPLDKKNEKLRAKLIGEYDSQKRVLGILSSDDGSYEGFAFDRAYLGRLNFGAPTVRVDEYGDKLQLMKRASYLLAFYNKLLELVDYDELGAKSIKDRTGATPGSSGMGISLYYTLSHPDIGQKEEIKKAVLKSIGRRGFLLRETNQTIKLREITPLDPEAISDFQQDIQNVTEALYARFSSPESSRSISLIPAAQLWYAAKAKALAADLQAFRDGTAVSVDKDVKCALMADLDRKILKVAALLAVFNHGESHFDITVADLEAAEQIVNRSYASALKFFDMSDYNPANEVLAYLQGAGDSGRSALDMLNCRAFWGLPKRNFQDTVFSVLMNEIAAEAQNAGYILEHFKVRKRDFYRLRLQTSDDIFLEKDKNVLLPKHTDTPPFGYSVRSGLDISKVDDYNYVTTIAELPKVLAGNNLYSACKFKNGIRNQDNFESANLIILDYDDGLSIPAAQELFKDYSYILATTRHHNLPKGGDKAKGIPPKPPCDRFRVVLFSDYTFTDRQTFRAFMQYMTDKFGSDISCKDAARTYYGNPDAAVFTQDARLFPAANIVKRLEAETEAANRAALKPRYANAATANSANTISSFILHDAHGQVSDASAYIAALPMDDTTVPIRCPWHDDSHASAFASHRSNGGLQVSCSVCNSTKFIT